jgi:transposase
MTAEVPATDQPTRADGESAMVSIATSRQGRRYTPAFKQRAVDAVLERRKVTGVDYGSIQHVAEEIGCSAESLRQWVRRAEATRASRTTTATRPPMSGVASTALEREVGELRRENKFLLRAALYFATELQAHVAPSRRPLGARRRSVRWWRGRSPSGSSGTSAGGSCASSTAARRSS